MEQDAPMEKGAATESATDSSSTEAMTTLTGAKVSATPVMIQAMAWTCPTCSAESMVAEPRVVAAIKDDKEIGVNCRCGETLIVYRSKVYSKSFPHKKPKIALVK